MIKLLKTFFEKQDGAVTVDWIVLSAAIVGLSISAISSAQSGVNSLAVALSGEVSAKEVDTSGN